MTFKCLSLQAGIPTQICVAPNPATSYVAIESSDLLLLSLPPQSTGESCQSLKWVGMRPVSLFFLGGGTLKLLEPCLVDPIFVPK